MKQEGVFDYGRFECDSGLAYRSVCLFGRIRIVDDREVKQRFCEALMAKYGKPETKRPKGFLPRIDVITVYAIAVERMTGKECSLLACERQDEDAKCFIAHGRSLIFRTDGRCKLLNKTAKVPQPCRFLGQELKWLTYARYGAIAEQAQ
jgi:hypothetical protein